MINSRHTIALEPVASKALASIGYDKEAKQLDVQFHSGHIVRYSGVPASVWEAFQAVPSKGAFWNAEIKRSGQFTGEKITGTCKCGDIGLLEQTCEECGCSTYQK